MKDVIWVAVLKQRGFSPRVALELMRREMREGEGLLFVGPTGLLSTVRTEGEKSFPTKTIRPVEGEDAWVTAMKHAGRAVVLWERGDYGKNPGFRQALQEKKPMVLVRPNGRRSEYENGQWMPSAELAEGLEI